MKVEPVETVKYLFTTKTCPNCRIAKEALKGQAVEIIDAEEHADLVEKFGVRQAPTLVVVRGDGAEKYVNASNIQKYAEDIKG